MNSVVLAHLTPYTMYTVQIQALTRMGGGPLSKGKSIRTLQGGMWNWRNWRIETETEVLY